MRRSCLVTALVFVCGMSWCLAAANPDSGAQPAEKPSAAAAKKKAAPKPLLTISKKTTVITAPLRPDGYPDYVAALNELSSKGVTPENNAAVPFIKAMGLGDSPKQYRDRYCKAIGIEPLTDDGTYFVSWDKYVKGSNFGGKPGEESWKQFTEAQKRPWKADEFPSLAGWLEKNKPSLDLVVEATERPRWYSPMIAEKNSLLIAVPLPVIERQRNAGRALMARAMGRLQEGKLDQAWADLLAGHRLARLTGQGPILIDFLVALTVEGQVCQAEQALLQDARLTAERIAAMRADLAKLPPPADMADKLDHAERFMYLDSTMSLARDGLGSLSRFAMLTGGGDDPPLKSLMDDVGRVGVDWDIVLRMGNKWYDRLVAAQRKPTWTERQKALQQVDRDLRKLAIAAKDPASFALLTLADPRQGIAERLGMVMTSLLLPATISVGQAEARGTMRFELTQLAFALAEYRARQGSYPAKLADLVPKYVARVPGDIFADGDLHYRRQGDGCLLYSVGSNGKDDGGRNRDDRPEDDSLSACDDIAVHMAPRK
ncbi:MAG: hypothetical protein ACLQLG_17455 [Thermoguttaceae bacterium]